MAKKLSAEELRNWESDGFIFGMRAFGGDRAASYLKALEASEAVLGPLGKGNNFKPHLLTKWANEIMREPQVLDAVEDLIGPNILALTTTVFPKSPGHGAFVGWHQDGTYFGLEPPIEVTAWVALTDAPVESGCMEMLIGSHKHGQLMHYEASEADHMLSVGQTVEKEYQVGESKHMALKAGEFSIHHTHVIHRSSPNRASFRRVGVALTYIPTHVQCVCKTKPSATLVRGVDDYGHFVPDRQPVIEYGEEERAFHQEANRLFREVYDEERVKYVRPASGQPAHH